MNSELSDSLPARPLDEWDSLYNPAFLALVLAQAAHAHEKRVNVGLPFSLAFLVAPIVLHGPTRRELPPQARSKMADWLAAHPVERAGLAPRARSLAPSVRAGIRFGLETDLLVLRGESFHAAKPKIRSAGVLLSDEVDEIIKQARYVGGWFALAGSPTSIYALWRVAP